MEVVQNPAEVVAFATFAAVVAGTPGPSNALLTAIGARIGFRHGLPSLLGQVTGMGAMLFAITLGLGRVLLAHPLVLQILKWAGVALLGWMAWRIATAKRSDGNGAARGGFLGLGDGRGGFLGMAAFQWVNPKGWLVSVAAVATFLNPRGDDALAQAAFFAILFWVVALPSCLPWLAFGATLQRYLRSPRAERILNWSMATLLAGSTILLVWTRI
jgi:threonine/homoserine/homoserine lactone efflux protein